MPLTFAESVRSRESSRASPEEIMNYIDGFVIPVPTDKKEAHRALAAKAVPIFAEYGAIRIIECWGDDLPAAK